MLAVFTYPWWVFISRTMDRFGKGIRTSARDAMLSAETTRENKGKVFGLHRGMDTTGACLGPIFALVYLWYFPGDYKTMFLIAFIPGMLGLLLTFLIQEKKNEKKVETRAEKVKFNFFHFLRYWKTSPQEYKKIVIGFLFFALMNSSDIFLLLRIKSLGYDSTYVIGAYIFYNFVYAIVSYPVGILADKIGMKKVFVAGLIIFAIVYSMMAMELSFTLIVVAYTLYGIFAASTEGISKAWITNLVPDGQTGTALGFFLSFNSIFTLLASTMAGFLWSSFSPTAALLVSSIGAFFTAIYFGFMREKN
jgi:MFS family permease